MTTKHPLSYITCAFACALAASADPDRPAARDSARRTLLEHVEQAWAAPPPAASVEASSESHSTATPARKHKLDRIVIPSVSFDSLPLSDVVRTLSQLSLDLDPDGGNSAGVNFVLLDDDDGAALVTLNLRQITLRRVLDFATAATNHEYEITPDAVIIRPRGTYPPLDTRFFAISRATVLRLCGGERDTRTGGTAATPTSPGPPPDGERQRIRDFLESAGVSFSATPGAALAFDGSQLIVTQSARHHDLIQRILARYQRLRQVEIEAKFMEVQEGVLEELGVQWRAATREAQENARVRGVYSTGNGATRSLNEAFSFQGQNRTLEITVPGNATAATDPDGNETPVITPGVSVSLPVAPPSIPGGVSLAAANAVLGDLTGMLGEFDVNAIIRALQQRSGTELLSAPKLTVLSGNSATITVAQELRYPQSYGQIQSQVGTGSVNGGGSAGVSITSGTPQEFATRNVGVELRVTATVEEDDRSISLDLNPKVTEFEGFVEYGGPSVAISGGTTVTVPPGFYQPIFAVREVTTRVTLWDGATLVMGGLTREDVKKVQDKVPILGSLPLIGRLFRSEGESSQKRNLIIFVTARLVDPSGAPARANGGEAASAEY